MFTLGPSVVVNMLANIHPHASLLSDGSLHEGEEATLPTVLHSAPTLLHSCVLLHALGELRSACRATRALAQPEVTGLLIDIQQPLVSARLLELPGVLKPFRLHRLHLTMHYQGQGRQRCLN